MGYSIARHGQRHPRYFDAAAQPPHRFALFDFRAVASPAGEGLGVSLGNSRRWQSDLTPLSTKSCTANSAPPWRHGAEAEGDDAGRLF